MKFDTNDPDHTHDPLPWPHFKPGDSIRIAGYPFKVVRINIGSIVVQPLPARGYSSPRQLIAKMA